MEPLTPTSSPHSPFSGAAKMGIIPPEVFTAKELLSNMKGMSSSLGAVFEDLQNQTMQTAFAGEDSEMTQEINKLRAQMREQDRVHREAIAEIQLILDDFLEEKIFEHLKRQAQQEIADKIDELVREQVALCLETHIPQDLQNEVAEYQHELKTVQVKLNNSESRRANASVRSNQQDDSLHMIYMSNGEVSAHFPKTIRNLFNLDAEACKALMHDYKLSNPSEARDWNLNRFMHFCGITYQLVRTGVGMEPL